MSAKTDLEQAAQEASTVIAQAASEAVKVIAAATSEALKVSNVKHDDDHDILIEVRTKLEGLKADIRDLKDGTSKEIADHEIRITTLEESKTRQVILSSLGIALLTLLCSLVTYHIMK